jgi:adsorption protein A
MNKNHVASALGLAGILSICTTSALAQFQGPAVGGATQVPQGSDDGAILLAQASTKRKQFSRATPSRPASGSAAPTTTSDPAYIAADAAYKAYDRRDYEIAIGQAREATRLAPANRGYWQLLVNSLIAAHRLDEADAALNQGLQAGGDDATLRAQREPIRRAMAQAAGTAMYRALEAGALAAATRSARAAVQLAPDNAAYRLILINVLLRGDQFAEAEQIAGETVALPPESAVPLALRAYARQRLGRWREARADLDRALQQPGLSDAARRNLRLIAADSALAARDPQRTLELLQSLPEGDDAAARRRVEAGRLAVAVSAQPPVLTTAGFPPPALDCGAVESVSTCALAPGQPARDPAYDLAAAGYRAMEARDYAQAADKAAQAVAVSPGNRDYQRLLLNAQLGAGRLADAEQAATAALALEPTDAGLLAQRGSIRKRLGDEAGAAQDLEAALATGRLPPASQVRALADLGRNTEARERLAELQASNQLQGASELDLAYLAARVGDDRAAREAFARADVAGQLPETSLQDSAYAALRAGRDGEAVDYFKRTVDAADSLKLRLEPQILFNTRRAIADITREGGVTAALIYRGGGSGLVSGFGATPQSFGGKTAQVGVEAWWRPFGYRNGRYVDIFARGFETLYSQAGGATGGDSLQTALGIRWKPFSTQNAVLSLSRVFSHGAPDDWLAQAAYSLDLGTDLRVDVDNWWTTRVAAEVGRYTQAAQTYGLASVQVGKSYRLPGDGKTVLFPHGIAAAEYNSVAVDKTSVAAGPGVSVRHWFREDKYSAPRSYVDFSLQYRFRVAGDERAKGLFLTSLISY